MRVIQKRNEPSQEVFKGRTDDLLLGVSKGKFCSDLALDGPGVSSNLRFYHSYAGYMSHDQVTPGVSTPWLCNIVVTTSDTPA